MPGFKSPKPLDLEGLLNYAARVLTGRAQSLGEMREKLKRRAARREDVDAALERLREAGFLNDQKLAESVANWRRDVEGLGKTRVLRDLAVRRVAPGLAREAVDAAYSSADEPAMIEKFLERKFRGKNLGELLAEPKNLASAYRKLRLAGFSTGNSIRVLKQHAAAAERLEEMEEE